MELVIPPLCSCGGNKKINKITNTQLSDANNVFLLILLPQEFLSCAGTPELSGREVAQHYPTAGSSSPASPEVASRQLFKQ